MKNYHRNSSADWIDNAVLIDPERIISKFRTDAREPKSIEPILRDLFVPLGKLSGSVKKHQIDLHNMWSQFLEFDIHHETVEIGDPYESLMMLDRSGSSSSSSAENIANNSRLRQLEKDFSIELLRALRIESPEPGVLGTADKIIERNLQVNQLATMSWLNRLYIDNLHRPSVAADILFLVGRLPYDIANPTGVTMAVGGLASKSCYVVESAIRAFENWRNPESLSVLESVRVKDRWLQDYLEEVKIDLKEELCLA